MINTASLMDYLMQKDSFGDFSLCIRLSPQPEFGGRRSWYESGTGTGYTPATFLFFLDTVYPGLWTVHVAENKSIRIEL